MSMPYMNASSTDYALQFNNINVELSVRQQPKQALVTQDSKEKSRRPVDPPPIVEMTVESSADPTAQWLVSPYFFVLAILLEGAQGEKIVNSNSLLGQTSSSLHKLKDVDNRDGGFFIFGDLSVRKLGIHRLRFNLFNTDKTTGQANFLTFTDSEPFEVLAPKDFKGLEESTHLSRAFADQGVRLRLRKEARTIGGKRGYYSPEHQLNDQYGRDTRGIKRQRSDSDYNPHAYPRYTASEETYFSHGTMPPGAPRGAWPGHHEQGYPPATDYRGFNLHGGGGPGGQFHFQGNGQFAPSLGSQLPRTQAPKSLSTPTAGASNLQFGANTPASQTSYIGSNYEHQTSDQYGARSQTDTYTGSTGLQTPASLQGTAMSHNAGYFSSDEYGSQTGGGANHQEQQGGQQRYPIDIQAPLSGLTSCPPPTDPILPQSHHTTSPSFSFDPNANSASSQLRDAGYPGAVPSVQAANSFSNASSSTLPLTSSLSSDSSLNSRWPSQSFGAERAPGTTGHPSHVHSTVPYGFAEQLREHEPQHQPHQQQQQQFAYPTPQQLKFYGNPTH